MATAGKSSYSTKVLNTLSSRDLIRMYSLSYIKNKQDSVYGREIMTHLKELNLPWTPSHGTLYPVLKEMVKDEVLYIEEIEGDRKYYKMTEKGEQYYSEVSKDFISNLRATTEFYDHMIEEICKLGGIKEGEE